MAPYGVNLERFHPGEDLFPTSGSRPLRILFVGTVNQRKGIKYLLEAVRMLGTSQIELVIRGRAVDDLQLVRKIVPNAGIRLSVSHEELLAAYRSSDLFVFPSIGEGFGHVLLESLASGLPVLSTTSTAAPDLITEGVDRVCDCAAASRLDRRTAGVGAHASRRIGPDAYRGAPQSGNVHLASLPAAHAGHCGCGSYRARTRTAGGLPY